MSKRLWSLAASPVEGAGWLCLALGTLALLMLLPALMLIAFLAFVDDHTAIVAIGGAPFALLAVGTLLVGIGGRWRAARRRDGCCPRCGYDVRGLQRPGACPECGVVS